MESVSDGTREELDALDEDALDDMNEYYGPGLIATGERIVTEIMGRWQLTPIESTYTEDR